MTNAIGNITCPDCEQVYHSGHIDCSCWMSHPSDQCGRTKAERTCTHPWHGEAGAPPHKNSPNCESGKRPHCTCDRCF